MSFPTHLYRPFSQPIDPPDALSGGLVCVTFEKNWVPYVLGALTVLGDTLLWKSDVDRAIGELNNLLVAFQLQDCEGVVAGISGLRINNCVLEYTVNNVNWLPVGNFDNCYVELTPNTSTDNIIMATNDSVALIMQAWATSMVNDLLQWKNYLGTKITWIDKNAQLNTGTAFIQSIRSVPGSAPVFQIGPSQGAFRFNPSNSGKPTLVVVGETTITKDMQQWTLSNGTIISGVDRLGRFRHAITSGIPTDVPTIEGVTAVDPDTRKLYIFMDGQWVSIGEQGEPGEPGGVGPIGPEGQPGQAGILGDFFPPPELPPDLNTSKEFDLFMPADGFAVLPTYIKQGDTLEITSCRGWCFRPDEELFWNPGDNQMPGSIYCGDGSLYDPFTCGNAPADTNYPNDPSPSSPHFALLVQYSAYVGSVINVMRHQAYNRTVNIIEQTNPIGGARAIFLPNVDTLDGNIGGLQFHVVHTRGSYNCIIELVSGTGYLYSYTNGEWHFVINGNDPLHPTYAKAATFRIVDDIEGDPCTICKKIDLTYSNNWTPPFTQPYGGGDGCGSQADINVMVNPWTELDNKCVGEFWIASSTDFDFKVRISGVPC